jgi:two-component system phosphate regulon sensor histidine kinase PhoR
VTLRWRAADDGGHLEVEDTGIGIEAHHVPRLTERFYRVDKARSREVGGTGLGLAIVKHVLARHGATLSVRSTPGEGSTFSCDFPVDRVGTVSAPAPSTH